MGIAEVMLFHAVVLTKREQWSEKGEELGINFYFSDATTNEGLFNENIKEQLSSWCQLCFTFLQLLLTPIEFSVSISVYSF